MGKYAKGQYGVQMYSIRDLAEVDLFEALRTVARDGYSFVEFAGFFGKAAKDVRGCLDENHLLCSGTHTGIDALKPENIDETIAYHQAIGCRNLIVPAADWSSEEKMNENIALLNAATKKLSAAGITLGYHNHSGEFLPTPYGKVVIDELLRRTSVALEIDTFWSFNAGIDTIAFLNAHRDRIPIVHIKDGVACPPENRNFEKWPEGSENRVLGEGEAPVGDVYRWALENDVLMVVESESLNPSGSDEVARCIGYLRSLE